MNDDARKEAGKCPECGSIYRDARYSISTQIPAGDLPEIFCRNAWHDVPSEVHRDEFTEQEFGFIFGVCVGLPAKEIAEQCELREDVVRDAIYATIFKKAGVSTRAEFVVGFVMTALNAELKRGHSTSEEARNA